MSRWSIASAVSVLALLFLSCHQDAVGATWVEDFEAAKVQATKEKKDLLIDFTGSDWCGWCIRLDEEVFIKEEFMKEVQKHFVMVKLDFPQQKELPKNIADQNKALQEKYKVEGFPTILLTDGTGKAYGKTGYQPGGPEKYLPHLMEIKGVKSKYDGLLVQAGKAQGAERAKLLDEAISTLSKNGVEDDFEPKIKEIKELDKDNKAGLKHKWDNRDRLDEIAKKIGETRDLDKALADLDAFLKNDNPATEIQQEALMFQANIYIRGKDDKAKGIAKIKEAIQADPKSKIAQDLAEYVKRLEAPAPPAEGSEQ